MAKVKSVPVLDEDACAFFSADAEKPFTERPCGDFGRHNKPHREHDFNSWRNADHLAEVRDPDTSVDMALRKKAL